MPALEQRYDQSSATEDSEDFVNANAPSSRPPSSSHHHGRRPSSSASAAARPSSRTSSRHSAPSKVHSSSSSESELSDSEEERQLQEELEDAGGVEDAGAVRGAPKKTWIMQSVSKGRGQSRAQQEYSALNDAEAGTGGGYGSSSTRQHSRRSSRSGGMAGEQEGQVHRSSSRSHKHKHKHSEGGEKRSRRSHRNGAGTEYAIGKGDPSEKKVKQRRGSAAPLVNGTDGGGGGPGGAGTARATKSKQKIWLGIIGAIILIAVIVGVVVLIIDQTKKSDNEEASATAESAAASNGTASATGSNSLSTAQEPSSYGDTATFKSGTEAPGSPTTTYDDGKYHGETSAASASAAGPTGLSSLGGDDEADATKSDDLLDGASSGSSSQNNGLYTQQGSSAPASGSAGADDLLTLGAGSTMGGASATGDSTASGENGNDLLTAGGQTQSGQQQQGLPTQAGDNSLQGGVLPSSASQASMPTGLGTASGPDATVSSSFSFGQVGGENTQQQQGQQTGWNAGTTASFGNGGEGQQQQTSLSNAFGAQPTVPSSVSSGVTDPNAASSTDTNEIGHGGWGAPSSTSAATSVPLGPGPQVISQPQDGQQSQIQGQGQGQDGWGVAGGQAPTGASTADGSAPSSTDAWGAPAASPTQQGQYNSGMWNGDTSVGQNSDDGQYHGTDGQNQQGQNGPWSNTSNNGQWSNGWGAGQNVEQPQSPYSNATAYQATAPESYQTYQGNGTWFETSGHYGACGVATNKTDYVVALSDTMWLQSTNGDATKQSSQCNAEVLLTNKATGMSIKAWVTERCATCVGDASLDLSKPVFAALSGGSYEVGRLDLIWGFTGETASASASPSTGSAQNSSGVSSANGLLPTGSASSTASGTSGSSPSETASSSTSSEEDEDSGWFRRRGLPTQEAQPRRRRRAL